MTEQEVHVICVLKKTMDDPLPGSVMRWCHICAEEVWVSRSAWEAAQQDRAFKLICTDCAPGSIEATGASEFTAHPRIMAALREVFPEAQVQEFLHEVVTTRPEEGTT